MSSRKDLFLMPDNMACKNENKKENKQYTGGIDMKKYEMISKMDDNSSIVTGVAYIGTTADIKALCKSIRRASEKESTNLYFLFGGAVRFSENKQVYGLVISDDDTVTIITSDTFAMMLVSGELKDVTQ